MAVLAGSLGAVVCAGSLGGAAALMEPTVEYKSGDLDAYQSEYLWIVVLGIIAAFFMSWGIGANDVANSFASSVGSKALTLRQAVAIATVMEFVGCLAMGASVTDTVRKGIIDAAFLKENPEILQLGMLSALCGAGLWLLICSALGSPVSTTHSIIGSLLGISLCVNPESLNGRQVGLVVLSWLTSPLFSGILACLIFLAMRAAILRSEGALERGFKFFPLLIFFTFSVFCLYLVFKNPQVDLKAWRKEEPGLAVLLGFGVALVLSAMVYFPTIGMIRKRVEETPEDRVDAWTDKDTERSGPEEGEKRTNPTFAWDRDLHADAAAEEGALEDMLANCEKFPAKTEKLFSYLQVVSAAFDSLAHGANDVANAVGPMAAIWGIHEAGEVSSKVDVPVWVLALGGLGICIGLLTYGYNVIKSIGMKLTVITPSRGFSIEMGSAIVVIIGSNLGIPLSTTHCQVGATVGVGMCEINGMANARKGVNWRLMAKVGFMWVATLVFAGICSSAIFGFLSSAYHPMSKPLPCGPIGANTMVPGIANSTKADMQALFRSLDANADEELDDDEMQGVFGGQTLGGDKVVEKYGRRRRRTPSTITESDFLEFTCTAVDKLDHMERRKCEPRCASGLRANKDLSCKLSSTTNAQGGFSLSASYSGFAACAAA